MGKSSVSLHEGRRKTMVVPAAPQAGTLAWRGIDFGKTGPVSLTTHNAQRLTVHLHEGRVGLGHGRIINGFSDSHPGTALWVTPESDDGYSKFSLGP